MRNKTKNKKSEYLGIAEELIIGYEIIKDGWERNKEGKRIRVIKKAKLLEVSLSEYSPRGKNNEKKEWKEAFEGGKK